MKENIIRMAREAGLGFLFEDHLLVYGELERFAALVAAAEREACANLCDELQDYPTVEARHCAEEIRARGQA